MVLETLLGVKSLAALWLLAGNILLVLWAAAAYLAHRLLPPGFGVVFWFVQALIGLQLTLGVAVSVYGLPAPPLHLVYGVANGVLAGARILALRPLAAAGRRGTLWHGALALLAAGLTARAAVTGLQ